VACISGDVSRTNAEFVASPVVANTTAVQARAMLAPTVQELPFDFSFIFIKRILN
jgi:hypothetical protein